jgi:hypothetical protein
MLESKAMGSDGGDVAILLWGLLIERQTSKNALL